MTKDMVQTFKRTLKWACGFLAGVGMIQLGYTAQDAIAVASGLPIIVGFFVD